MNNYFVVKVSDQVYRDLLILNVADTIQPLPREEVLTIAIVSGLCNVLDTNSYNVPLGGVVVAEVSDTYLEDDILNEHFPNI